MGRRGPAAPNRSALATSRARSVRRAFEGGVGVERLPQLRPRVPEGMEELPGAFEGEVRFAPLHRADVGAVEAGLSGKRFLRQIERLSPRP